MRPRRHLRVLLFLENVVVDLFQIPSAAFVPLVKVALRVPATELTSVQVQWRAGDPTTGTDQNALPLALSIEASVDGGKEWHGITGGDEAVDLALAHKASPGSSQHRYPVSLLALRRKR